MVLLTDLYAFMESASNTYADLIFVEERSRENPDLFTTQQKTVIQEMSRKFFMIMNSGATTDSLEQLAGLLGVYANIIDALFQQANEYEYEV